MTHTENNELTTGPGARFTPGELVDVTIRGARVASVDSLDVGLLGLEVGNFRTVANLRNAGYQVTRRAPVEWPPQPADVWSDRNGDTWAALGDLNGAVEMRPTVAGPDRWRDPYEVLGDVGPMRLEYRPGWTPAPPAADVEPAEVDERAAMVAAIREFADWLEANTDLPVPYAVDAQAYPETLEAARSLAERYGARIARDDDQVLSAKVGIGDRANGYPLVNYTLYLTKPQPPMPMDEEIVDLTGEQTLYADERGDAEKTAIVEEDAAERASLNAEIEAEIEAAENAAEMADEQFVDNQCTAVETIAYVGQTGEHRCTLYGDGHTGPHICLCGRSWSSEMPDVPQEFTAEQVAAEVPAPVVDLANQVGVLDETQWACGNCGRLAGPDEPHACVPAQREAE